MLNLTAPSRPSRSFIEALEARIAPAVVFPDVFNPLPDIKVGPGKTSDVVDLTKIFDTGSTGEGANHTFVEFHLNFDSDPLTPGMQNIITIELFDDVAPLTVQNFLSYVESLNKNGDYDGTFFHRLAFNGTTPFVLQGGGFQLDKLNPQHIDTLPEVHNEFNPLYSNLRGTLALAKTGLGENTGTSEFFINLSDNSQNLDNQNGGFTVFGRVVDMAVVDAITNLQRAKVVGDFEAPVQNYNPDPDHNPLTPPPKPSVDNLIQIVDAKIVQRPAGDFTGITYSVAIESQGSQIVTPILSNGKLTLQYLPGAAGTANVVVTATNGSQSVDIPFTVQLQPNLITHLLDSSLTSILVPGDSGKVKIDLVNNGGAVAQGLVNVKLFLQKSDDPSVRIEIGSLLDQRISVASGAKAEFMVNVALPGTLASDQGAQYKLYAEVTPKDGSFNSDELFTDDNRSVEAPQYQLYNAFGTFNGRKNVPLTYTEADGDVVSFTIKGPGYATLTAQADGASNLEIIGATQKTKVQLKVIGGNGNGTVDIGDIRSTGYLSLLDFGAATLYGNLSFPSGAGTLTLGDVAGPSVLSLGAQSGKGAKLSFGQVKDLSVNALSPIASLTAVEWLNTDGQTDLLLAPALKKITITGAAGVRGDFQADLALSSQSAKLASMRVAGSLSDSLVRILGNVGNVQVGGMENSSFLVGALERPDDITGFIASRTLGKFQITGMGGDGASFLNSTVSAATIGKVLVHDVSGASGGTEFGFVADVIRSYNRDGAVKMKKLDAPGLLDSLGDYGVRLV